MTTSTTSMSIQAAFITPVVPVDPIFLGLMVHYVDFQEMSKGTSAASSYGHRTVSRDTVSATTSEVRSRFRSLTTDEIESTGREGEVVADHMLYVPFGYLPTKLTDPKNSVIFRVVNVRTRAGIPVDAGPLDIQSVKLVAGERHHYELRLRKVN